MISILKKTYQFFFSLIFNRRKYFRIKIALPIHFKVIFSSGNESASLKATSEDLSCEGMSFLIKSLRVGGEHLWFNDALSTRNILELDFSLPNTKKLNLKGEICYFNRLDDYDKNFKIGINFIDLEKEDLKIIKKFILDYKTQLIK